jgi:hypothetical protein
MHATSRCPPSTYQLSVLPPSWLALETNRCLLVTFPPSALLQSRLALETNRCLLVTFPPSALLQSRLALVTSRCHLFNHPSQVCHQSQPVRGDHRECPPRFPPHVPRLPAPPRFLLPRPPCVSIARLILSAGSMENERNSNDNSRWISLSTGPDFDLHIAALIGSLGLLSSRRRCNPSTITRDSALQNQRTTRT